MEEIHRNIIRRNHCELLNNCNFQSLLPKLVKNGVFTRDSIRTYEKCDYESKVNLLFDLLGRGPNAFNNFLLSLQETNQTQLANKLLGLKDVSPVHLHTVPIFPKKFTRCTAIDLRTENKLCIDVVSSDSFKDDFSQLLNPYTMRSQSRGAVLIINNKIFLHDKPRKGAQVDQENLQELFKQMGGYTIILKENRTALQMQKDIKDFANNNVLKSVDVMFLIIMSHGSAYVNESQVKCVDEEFVRTSWIESQFFGDNCPNLQNKPKIIIYQICRGSDLDSGIRKTETDGVGIIPTRKHSDMLICHSTSQGYKAHRDTELGSWYIQCICEIFMRYAHSNHVETLLHIVDEHLSTLQSDDVDKTMQTPNFYNLGFRHCFLNPGIYEENKQLYRYNN